VADAGNKNVTNVSLKCHVFGGGDQQFSMPSIGQIFKIKSPNIFMLRLFLAKFYAENFIYLGQ